ncbi:MAG: hypothetical protein RMJ43_12550 [Chloroherpetonaceae bacterium]|nr:hypothetical protein [Chthonomonadaceae bacterium]MDW8208659.1 hypothetical protein [Chloroherpetonaceae bacterium]
MVHVRLAALCYRLPGEHLEDCLLSLVEHGLPQEAKRPADQEPYSRA